jgi:hypothetical protein
MTLIASAIFVSFVGYNIAFKHTAMALSGSEFNAGRIIDDTVMFDGNAMSSIEIQQFLNAKVPSCDETGTQASSHWNDGAGRYYTRAEWGSINGYPAPYTCLKNYTENTASKAADTYCSGNYVGGIKTAAQIINDVARACNVSQKSLIVLLQKEQGLITDDWPWSIQYRSATGYGCPDTAACDSTYYGFFNQVYNAARQFQRYVKQPDIFNYRSGVTRYIQYNPNAGCGGTNIYLENGATAALYNYTPYQPNASALNNLYGSGDSCGAYGNRNFWRMFNDWFGSTAAPAFSWQPVGQAAYTDASKTVARGLQNTMAGDRIYLSVVVKNTGNFTWTNSGANPIFLGTSRPNDRSSIFKDNTWPGNSRPSVMAETTVAPGSNATFNFWVKIPGNISGNYNEYYNLVREGVAWFPDQGLYFGINVTKASYTWDLVSQYAASDELFTVGRSLIDLEPGERIHVNLRMRNTGNVTWLNSGSNPVNLGITRPTDRYSYFFDDQWLGQNRPARMKETSVAPGQVATFEFWMKAPNRPGPFYEYFTPVVEGLTWMPDIGLNYFGTIKNPIYTYNLQSQYAYTNSSKSQPIGLSNLVQGSTVFIGFTVHNTGNITWYRNGPNPIGIGTSRPIERISPFFADSWLGQTRPARMKEVSVAPGQVATFEFDYKVPMRSGNYLEYVNLVAEGITWMPDIGINFNSRVL